MARINKLFISTVLFFSVFACEYKDTIIYSSDYYSSEADATPAFLEMINDLKKLGGGILRIKQGTYHFYPDKAFEKLCYISNHDDGLRSTPFPIINMKDITILGDNVRFIFHGIMIPFLIESSENIKISGISIDWEMPFHSEAVVLDNCKKTNSFDILISGEYPYTIRNGELMFIKEGYEHNLERAILWDPKTKAVAYNTIQYTPLEPYSKQALIRNEKQVRFQYPIEEREPQYRFRYMENKLTATELEPGYVRITGSDKALPPVGLVMICKGRNGFNRIAPAFRLLKSSQLELTDVTVNHAGGMGLIAEKCEDIGLNRFNVAIAEGSKRMLSTTADATHFVNCRGHIKMNECLFSNQLDDATNIHGTFLSVAERIDDYHVGVRIGHFQQMGFEFSDVGDQIGFVNPKINYTPFDTNTVKSVNRINRRYYILEFDKPLPEQVVAGIVLDNIDWYPRVHIKKCKALNNRARGFLISTPESTVIEECVFSTMMSAIYLPTELSWWYESGCAKNVIIKNNVFKDCCYGGNKTAVIASHVNSEIKGYIYENIAIENNTFSTFDNALVHFEKVSGLIIRNNTIVPSGTYQPLYPEEKAIEILESTMVNIGSNKSERQEWSDIKIDEYTRKTAIMQF